MNELHFFLIDDDEFFKFINEKYIAGSEPGYKIKFFSDGEKGIDYLKQNLGTRQEPSGYHSSWT